MSASGNKTVLILASGTLVSRVLGFVKAIVLAATLGLVGSASADAFANANALPTNIYQIISSGLLNAVLVPQIVRATKQVDHGREYINRLITLAIVVLGAMTLVLTIGAPVLSWFYGMTLSSEQLGLVTAFAFWCIPQVFFYGLYTIISEILNARSMFAPFAWAPVLNNVISIGVLVLFSIVFGADPTGARQISDWDPMMIALLGGGTTVGVALQAVVLFFFLKRAGYSYRPDFHFRGTGLGKLGKLAGWSFGVLIITQLVGWIETLVVNLAFGASASLAASQYAWMIFMLPHSLITVSLTTAMFTRLSEDAAANNRENVVNDFGRGARAIIMFMVFSAIGLMVISPAFARIFDANDHGLVALACILCAALLGLISYSLLFHTQRVYYAYEDTRAVFMLYLITTPPELLFMWSIAMFVPVEWLVVVIALLQSCFTTIRVLIQLRQMPKYTGSISGQRLLPTLLRYVVLMVPAAVVGLGLVWFMGGYTTGGFARSSILNAVLTCIVAGTAMVLIYFGLAMRFRMAEAESFFGPIVRRFDGERGRHSVHQHRHSAGAASAEKFAEEYGSLIDDLAMSPDTSPTASGAVPASAMAQLNNTTRNLPTRQEYRQYERQREREAYERQIERDDQTLI